MLRHLSPPCLPQQSLIFSLRLRSFIIGVLLCVWSWVSLLHMHVFYLCEHLYVSICCFYLLTPSHSKLLSFSQGVTSPWLSWEYVSQIPLLTPPRFPTVLTWASSREATLSVPARTQTRIRRAPCLRREPSSCGPGEAGWSLAAAQECPAARTLPSHSPTPRMRTNLMMRQVKAGMCAETKSESANTPNFSWRLPSFNYFPC